MYRIVLTACLTAGLCLSSAALAQTCPSNVPHLTGTWVTLPYGMPINPISATLLRSGKVLIIAGSENDASNNAPGAESYRAAIWDPTGTTAGSIAVQSLTYDVFCSGTSLLPDGRALVVGGTSDYSFKGDARASIFDPVTERFLQSQSMADGRWYGTATTLGDGSVVAFSGLGLSGATNKTVEIYDLRSAGAGWTSPVAAPFTPPLYPRMALLPNGRVFYTGHGSGTSNSQGWIFDPATKVWTASAPTDRSRSYGAGVLLSLLPPSYTPRMIYFGGDSPATNTTVTIDLSAATPAWTPGPNMSSGRIQMNAVLLPDGRVLAEGGSANNESPSMPGKRADLYDPASSAISSAGTAAYSRLYHSTATLLADGTVASLGSNPGARGSYQPAIEIYTPPYLFDANDQPIVNRPVIASLSSSVLGYGVPFTVSFTSATPITSAVLIRPGSTTHADDMEQRLVGLCGPAPQPACNGAASLSLTTPPNANIAPPGYYMLFLLDSRGVPSKATFLQLTPYSTLPPTGTIDSPAVDVTIQAGGSVAFSTNAPASAYSWVFPGGTPATSTAQNPGSVTFASAGIYTASLTVLDSSGNSDPSPPIRTVTVLPRTGDFSIEASPSAVTVIPGQSARFTVTVSPQSGFTGTVSLTVGSESGFPSGITSGGFSPPSIAGSGTSTLTMNTTSSTSPYALSLTITGTSGTLAHQASTTLLVNLAPPASLNAVAGDAQVALSWPAAAAASGYSVQRGRLSGGPYVAVACPASTSYTDTGLVNGTQYAYVVTATYVSGPDAGGASALSPEALATPNAVVPPAPTGLAAATCSNSVSLSWNASSGATSYRVKRASTSGGPYSFIGSPTSTSFTDGTAANGATWFYVVSAVNGGGESPNSGEASATPPGAAPAPPTALSATFVKQKAGSVSLAWTQSPTSALTQNAVYRRTSTGSYGTPLASISPGSAYLDSRPASGSYCYRVTASTCNGESVPSNEACATVR